MIKRILCAGVVLVFLCQTVSAHDYIDKKPSAYTYKIIYDDIYQPIGSYAGSNHQHDASYPGTTQFQQLYSIATTNQHDTYYSDIDHQHPDYSTSTQLGDVADLLGTHQHNVNYPSASNFQQLYSIATTNTHSNYTPISDFTTHQHNASYPGTAQFQQLYSIATTNQHDTYYADIEHQHTGYQVAGSFADATHSHSNYTPLSDFTTHQHNANYATVAQNQAVAAIATTNTHAVATAAAPGFVLALPSDATRYWDGSGAYSVPAGGSGTTGHLHPFYAPLSEYGTHAHTNYVPYTGATSTVNLGSQHFVAETAEIDGTISTVKVSTINDYLATNGDELHFLSGTITTAGPGSSIYGQDIALTSSNITNAATSYGLRSIVTNNADLSNTLYGVYGQIANNTALTNGPLTAYGGYFTSQLAGLSTGNANSYGVYAEAQVQSTQTAGTYNAYGVYVRNNASNGNGTTTRYGVYVEEQTGADTNWGAYIGGHGFFTGDLTATNLTGKHNHQHTEYSSGGGTSNTINFEYLAAAQALQGIEQLRHSIGSYNNYGMVIVDGLADTSGIDGATLSYNSALDHYGIDTTFTSQYPPAQSTTYVRATTADASQPADDATDPALSLTGDLSTGSWISNAVVTNQRFHIDLGSAKTVTRIYYENFHNTGASVIAGVRNFTFWGSNSAGSFTELTYGTDTGWTQLTINDSEFDQHVAANQADPKYVTVTNSTSYRYYAFKIADNWGGGAYMGARRFELQTGGGASGNIHSISFPMFYVPQHMGVAVKMDSAFTSDQHSNLRIDISRDGGATFTDCHPIYGAQHGYYRAAITDVTSQGSQANAYTRITLMNNTTRKLKGYSIYGE